MNKARFIASLNDAYCRLGVTAHGVGVVAIRPIPKGTDPFARCEPFGDLIKLPAKELDAARVPESAKNLVRDFCALQDGIYYVPNYGIDAIDKSYYVNHSKTPNLVALDGGERFVAARRIRRGEELTADYRTYNEEPRRPRFTR